MNRTRKARISEEKYSAQLQTFKKIRQSVAVVGTSMMIGLYVSPVAQVLAQEAETTTIPATNNAFLNSILESARIASQGKNVYTSVMLAQAALETGWGTSQLSQAPIHNLFGIKGTYNGESVNMHTLEDSGGQNYYQINAQFRKYPSYTESMQDYVDKITNGTTWNSEYYAGAWKTNTTSYKDATAYLTGRYATDTAYAAKLNRIIEQHDLTRYDTDTAYTIASSILDGSYVPGGSGTYTVKKGDTLYRIAVNHGISVASLLSHNGLSTSSVIQPGQQLQIPSATTLQAGTPASTSTSSSASGTYTVKRGDTLYRIALNHGISLSSLLSANGLSSSSTIYPGQVLNLSSNGSSASQASTSTATSSSASGTYTVKRGDTLYRIALNHGISLSLLLSANGLSSSSTIYPGQVLQLSSSGSSAAQASTTQTATPASTSTATSSSATGTYTVQRGDTLYRIALNHGISLSSLLSANGLTSSSTIYPGQVLQLSSSGLSAAQASTTQTATPASTSTATSSSASGTYTVKRGDTLYRIALNHGISLSSLLSANGLSSSSTIYPGQVLNVSGNSATDTPVAEASEASTTDTTATTSTTEATYTVKAGEGLWRIAKNHGLTLEQIKSMNGLSSNVIHPGQVLKVK